MPIAQFTEPRVQDPMTSPPNALPKTISIAQILNQVCQLSGIETSTVLARAGLSEEDCRAMPEAEAYFDLFTALRAVFFDTQKAAHKAGQERGQAVGPGAGTFEADLAGLFAKGPYLSPALALSVAPDLLTGLRRLARYKPLIAPVSLEIQEGGDTIAIVMSVPDENVSLPSCLALFEMLLIAEKMRIFTGADVRPLELLLPAGLERDYLHANLTAAGIDAPLGEAEDAVLVIARTDAERRILSANPGVWAALEPMLEAELRALAGHGSCAARLREELVTSLSEGPLTAEELAGRLGLSKRSLQRKLRAEGTTFQEVLNETRANLAQSYLSSSGLSLTEISHRLGFRSVSSFFRNFQSWVGMTPRAFRESHQAD